MRLYIAGPMTGLPDRNLPAFSWAENLLKSRGFEVESPARNEGLAPGDEYTWYIRAGLRQLLDCDGVALLPGFGESKGACFEITVASFLKMPIRLVTEWAEMDALPLVQGVPID